MKRITVLRGSCRKEGNTRIVTDAFLENFKKNNWKIDDFYLCEMNIDFFNPLNKYSKEDEFYKIEDSIFESDLIVFTTPMYWYSMSARLKNVFDRFNGIYVDGHIERLWGKSAVLLYTYSGNPYPEFIFPVKDTCEYLKMNYFGSFSVRGSFSIGVLSDDIEKTKDFSFKIITDINKLNGKNNSNQK